MLCILNSQREGNSLLELWSRTGLGWGRMELDCEELAWSVDRLSERSLGKNSEAWGHAAVLLGQNGDSWSQEACKRKCRESLLEGEVQEFLQGVDQHTLEHHVKVFNDNDKWYWSSAWSVCWAEGCTYFKQVDIVGGRSWKGVPNIRLSMSRTLSKRIMNNGPIPLTLSVEKRHNSSWKSPLLCLNTLIEYVTLPTWYKQIGS